MIDIDLFLKSDTIKENTDDDHRRQENDDDDDISLIANMKRKKRSFWKRIRCFGTNQKLLGSVAFCFPLTFAQQQNA